MLPFSNFFKNMERKYSYIGLSKLKNRTGFTTVSTQTAPLRHPSQIRLPSYSALYTETMYKVDRNSFTSLYANKDKMDAERYKLNNLKNLKVIEELKIENQKYKVRLDELEIAYKMLWEKKQGANAEKRKSQLRKVKEKRAEYLNQIKHPQMFMENSSNHSNNSLESNVLLKKNKRQSIANVIKTEKKSQDDGTQLQQQIKQSLEDIIKIKDIKISELQTLLEKQRATILFLEGKNKDLVSLRIKIRDLEEEKNKYLQERNHYQAFFKQTLHEKDEIEKQLDEIKQEERKKYETEQKYIETLRGYNYDLKINEDKINQFLKNEKLSLNQGIVENPKKAIEVYQETITYLMYMVRKIERKFADQLIQSEKQRQQWKQLLRQRDLEIQKIRIAELKKVEPHRRRSKRVQETKKNDK